MQDSINRSGLWIKNKGRIRLVPYKDISHILHNDGITEIHNGSEMLKRTLAPLGGLERQVPGHIFFRIHRNYIINRLYIRRCDTDNRFVVFPDGEKFPVSRRRRKDFKKFLDQKI